MIQDKECMIFIIIMMTEILHDEHNDRGNAERIHDNDALRIFAKNTFIQNDERLEVLLGELKEIAGILFC